MWWVVLCKGCKEEYIVRLNPDFDSEYTCMRLMCGGKLKNVKQVESEIKQKKDPYEKLLGIEN